MSACEFITDATARIILAARCLGISDEVARLLASEWEHGITRDWGGERPYVGKRGETTVVVMSRRNQAIVRDYRAGERVSLLARRYGISPRRVRQIITETL